MATIFENKYVYGTDTESRMRFPDNPNLAELPFPCDRDGQFALLTVTDEGGTQWTLTYKNEKGRMHVTEGWAAFRKAKGIIVGHKITLYKDDDFGYGAQYRIKVE